MAALVYDDRRRSQESVKSVKVLGLLSAAVLLVAANHLHATDSQPIGPTITGAKHILFLGDSVTYAGTYVDFIEAEVRLRDPAWGGEILELGLPSETVSGLSEPNHADGKFPRPDLHERLDRVLAQAKPDVVIACYGMNDAIYWPFNAERFEKFRAGITWLHEKVVAAHAEIVHVTPPVFDPQPIREKVLPGGLAAYPRPYAKYNDVLDRYSAWLLDQRAHGWEVIDVHGPMNHELAVRRNVAAEFTFSKDGIHPDRLGHAVMARAILSAWKFPAAFAEAPIKWASEPEDELLRLIHTRRKLLTDAWLTATGHQRPGMIVGAPLAEATAEAVALDKNIRELTTSK
jgi:lysophospholipase L1-like esterase